MAERKAGLGAIPAGLMRPTIRTETPEPAEPADAGEPVETGDEQQSRGDTASSAPAPRTRARRSRTTAETEARGRKLILPDDVHDRLWQEARRKRVTVSALAADILDRNLPRFTVVREAR